LILFIYSFRQSTIQLLVDFPKMSLIDSFFIDSVE